MNEKVNNLDLLKLINDIGFMVGSNSRKEKDYFFQQFKDHLFEILDSTSKTPKKKKATRRKKA